jgi:peptidoglycan/LPS O-acetylase OafA/YrhL
MAAGHAAAVGGVLPFADREGVERVKSAAVGLLGDTVGDVGVAATVLVAAASSAVINRLRRRWRRRRKGSRCR